MEDNADSAPITNNNPKSELILDDETEEYEEEQSGIKLEYDLKLEEIFDFLKNSDYYAKLKKMQKRNIIFELIVLVLLTITIFLRFKSVYLFTILINLISIIVAYFRPNILIRNKAKSIFEKNKYCVEIFPDRIEVQNNNLNYEINLNNSTKCEIKENLILIYSENQNDLIIPTRAVEPEFLSDIQAMIFSGTEPI
ncbi:MAG: hypothetical protein RsTaC01_1096 [Candidatus Paraimprobicoccus trichonymphae]|uniref:YcxB-like protein domain-containing protein n=1 Tax=Candidatus Paraimprobicoccus trichonymphae TaxID=3033793 RepID=A0AA48I6S0_9FIRM|nr:MAG: hypothetical protein RsTaC01_1096 [Candidatus Paraimprobicoccus trichonymphae]